MYSGSCALGLPSSAPFLSQLFGALLLGHLSKDAEALTQGDAIYEYAIMLFLAL